ncbi:hypothetical protein [Thalassobacillus sp. C254]|uniref:endonuclease/exonuclease/phosphatase family protein n=1 Tax=Thalassobacillus sp. C254 TaxID=1225341 RepID=UPI00277D1582|nr:hypothetical protein [Thalassobacillus sp. C254]
MEVKVMTYNIHHGKGMDRKVDINRIADVIAQSNIDIVGLNEVDKHFSRRSNHMDQISILAEKLNMYEAFSASITLKSKKALHCGNMEMQSYRAFRSFLKKLTNLILSPAYLKAGHSCRHQSK